MIQPKCPFCSKILSVVKSKILTCTVLEIRYCKPCRYAFTYDQQGKVVDIYRDVEL